MLSKLFLFIFLFATSFICSQITFYQDVCKCGVTGAGFSAGLGTGNGTVEIYIEPGSIVKKVYAIAYSFKNALSENYILNGIPLNFSENNLISNVEFPNPFATPTKIYLRDVTSFIPNNQQQFQINLPLNTGLEINEGFWSFYLFVVYENPSLDLINYNIFVNNIDFIGNEYYELNDLNPLNSINPISFSIYSDRTGSDLQGNQLSHTVSLNNVLLGIIGGSDNVNSNFSGAGVKGHFYYQNNQLVGLDDDTADPFMNGTDGLADISSYIPNLSTSFNFRIKHLDFPNQAVNFNSVNLAYFLAYTSPCSEFPTQTSTDTTLCQGATAQLFASGGQVYEWQPATGLSCTDCPNPIVTADSSLLYTVRIWNNDSCSVVRPIKVNVQPLPQFSGVGSTPTACGQNTGSAIAVAQNITPLPLSYSINGAPFAFSSTYTGNFANLSAGANTIILRDAFGCEIDTVIQIGVTNTTNAFFTATPNSGAAPLSVSFTNQSTNATNYNWFIESDFVGDNLLQHTFDTSGSYTVTLIAWQIDPLCADTFSIQIVVYDSLIIQIPNVFTPNGDGINDQFTITTNQPVSVEYHLFNRWGNVIAQDTKPTTAGSSNFVLPIWDGAGYSDGTYFYVIRVVHDGKEYEFDGFLERIE